MRPRLIHPLPVILEQLNRGGTDWDPDFDEPVEGEATYDDPVTLSGQVNYSAVSQLVTGGSAWLKDSIGRLVFLKADLEAAGITLGIGDKITSIDGREVAYYILEPRPQGHYDTATLIFAFFGDKEPDI